MNDREKLSSKTLVDWGLVFGRISTRVSDKRLGARPGTGSSQLVWLRPNPKEHVAAG